MGRGWGIDIPPMGYLVTRNNVNLFTAFRVFGFITKLTLMFIGEKKNKHVLTSSACHDSGLTFHGMNSFRNAACFTFATKKLMIVSSLFLMKGMMKG